MMADDDLRDDRIVHRRRRKSSEAMTRLCRAWFRAGAGAVSDSLRTAADVADDWTGDDCLPGARRDR
jgi:hypothetical protein